MSIKGLIKSKIYRQYMAWVFLKDWILIFTAMFISIYGLTAIVFSAGSFVTWSWNEWSYFKDNSWWYFRLSVIVSFILSLILEVYLFPDSYDSTVKELKDKQ